MTSKELYDSFPNKESYEWTSRGIHCYRALLKKEKRQNDKKNKAKKV